MAQYTKKLGEQVRKIRKGKKLSQEQLAEMSNLHRTYIGFIERSERVVSLETLTKLSNGLDMKLSELFKLIEQEKDA